VSRRDVSAISVAVSWVGGMVSGEGWDGCKGEMEEERRDCSQLRRAPSCVYSGTLILILRSLEGPETVSVMK